MRRQFRIVPAMKPSRRQRETAQLTPAERLHRFAQLQARADALLAAAPEGLRRFHERNRRQRRIHAQPH
jgi:hypothetical protein